MRTGFARIDGWTVGVIASDPRVDDGRIDAAACEKVARLLMLCDSFNVPVISLIDSAGLARDDEPDQERLLPRFVRLRQALHLASCPRLLVVTGRADGLPFASVASSGWATDGAYAWPGAAAGAEDDDGGRSRRIEEAAGVYGYDELIAPSSTRDVLVADLARLAHRLVPSLDDRPLAGWSTC